MAINLPISMNNHLSSHDTPRESSPIDDETRELSEVLQKIVRNAGALLEVNHCSVALLDPVSSSLVTMAALGVHGSKLRRTRFQMSEGVAGWVAEHSEPLILNDVNHDVRFKRLGKLPIGSMVCAPLVHDGAFVGTLTASSPMQNAFTPYKLHLLTVFADQAVLAIVNVRQAERVREAAREAARTKAHFLSMVTHELRSPLNAINGYLDLTLNGVAGDLNDQQREFMQRARAGSEHLYALVEDLLLVSRADAGQLRLNRDVIDLDEIMANAVEELELSAVDNGITVSVNMPSQFPALYADAVRLQQVLRNLISNALRFTPPGGTVTISARIADAGDEKVVEICVKDTGCGIAPEHQQRIFERFYQVPRTGAAQVGGQGLGLAIVKMIVELHGGHIKVESAPDQGSSFIFTLDAL